MDPNVISIIFMGVTAIATVVIACYAIVNHSLSSNIQKQSEEYQQQVSDLYQAIVISNILTDPSSTPQSSKFERNIKAFKGYYKGKTPIHLIQEDQ